MSVERDSEGLPLPHHEEDEISSEEEKSFPIRRRPVHILDVVVKFKRFDNNAKIPTKGTEGAAAFDVYAAETVELLPGETVIVPLGFAIEIPKGYDMKLLPRSGLSTKGVTVENSPGLIDEDYRGKMGVILRYNPPSTYKVIEKLYKALGAFCKNLVSAAQFNVDVARNRLADAVNVKPFAPFRITAGDRIGQVQIQKVVPFIFGEVDELTETKRGTGGFGSTGV